MTDQPAAPAWIDWITIWQSEAAALLADREVQEALQRTVDLWAAQAVAVVGAVAGALGQAADAAARRAGPAAPPRAAAAVDAPARDSRDGLIEQLLARVEQLLARVAELERRAAGPV